MQKKGQYLFLLLLLTLFPILLMGVGFYCCSYKRGFNIRNISSKLAYNEKWESFALAKSEEERIVCEVFSQVFYYLGSGNQCYMFASEDGKYVIKFFKMHKLLPKKWLRDFPFSLFEDYRLKHVEKKENLLENMFESLKICYEHLRRESGLVYLHLNKTRHLRTKLTIVSGDGKQHLIDLDSIEFVIQYKAQKLCDYLLTLKEKGKENEVHQAVRDFLELIAIRSKKGYGDQDASMRNSIGFVNDQAIFIDCCHLFADDSLKSSHYFQTEILCAAEKMSHWAEQFYPDLCLILQEEAQYVIDKYLTKIDLLR